MPASCIPPEALPAVDHVCADDELSVTDADVAVTEAAAIRDGGGGLGPSQLRDSAIDALPRGDDLPEIRLQAEDRALADRLAALRALTESAGVEIGNQIVRFVATMESFALALERIEALPKEIAGLPVLLIETCNGLTRIAAIGRELVRAKGSDFPAPPERSSVAPPC